MVFVIDWFILYFYWFLDVVKFYIERLVIIGVCYLEVDFLKVLVVSCMRRVLLIL